MQTTLTGLGVICLLALIIELDFFIALPKFGAEHFGAPDDLKEMVKKIPDKPKWVEICGLAVMLVSFCGIIAVFIWEIIDTYNNYPGLMQVFVRFAVILDGYKLFDILCFDYLLLTKIRLPEKLCPETKGARGYDSFGFNMKSQLTKLVIFTVAAFVIALIFSFICV